MKKISFRAISQLAVAGFCLLIAPALFAGTFIVTTANDESDTPPGASLSLREAIDAAANSPGEDTILFHSSLSGATIVLTRGPLTKDDGDGLTIDASALPGGLIINGNNADRVIIGGGTLTLRGLTLTGGNQGDCCGGAAVYSVGIMTLEGCTLTGNVAGFGPAIFTETGASTTLRQCTITQNSTIASHGAIYNRGTTFLIHCTVAGNTSVQDFGGIYNEADHSLFMENSIVAGNTGSTGGDVYNAGTLNIFGANLVQSPVFNDIGSDVTGPGTVTNVAPLLAAFGNYGGPTQTMPPLPGSPAIDATVDSTAVIDQRGVSRPIDGDDNGLAVADIGAVEFFPDVVLTNVTLSAGILVPAFDSATNNYTVNVGNAVTDLTVTPTATRTNGTITVNGSPVASGSASGPISLNLGNNTITLVITAPWPKTYTFVVHRDYPVSNTADSGAGSLRQAILDGIGVITFDPALNGQTITLTSGALDVTNTANLTIDASALPGGITINGNNANRIFVNDGILTVRALTLTGAFVDSELSGGAILNGGTMTLERCTVSGNTASYGGALYSFPGSTATFRHCTIANNVASVYVGGIYSLGTIVLTHCTVSGNIGQQAIGGIYNGSTITLNNCIIAGNSGINGADMQNEGPLNGTGTNIFQSSIINYGTINASSTILYTDPLLAPLGNYGGPTKTMRPQSGSPAIDGATGSTETTDQRGVARPLDGDNNGSALADIGAVEVDYPKILTHPVSQTVLAGANVPFVATAASAGPLGYQWFFNGDAISGANASTLNLVNVSRTNAGFYSLMVTNNDGSVTSSNALLHVLVKEKIQSATLGGDGRLTLAFNDATGGLLTTNELADFEVQASTNLTQWTPLTNAATLSNGVIYFTEPNGSAASRRFFRVQSK